jgi:hypothetical protein
MVKNSETEQIQKKLEQKTKKRLKKKRPKMAVSGKSVLNLSRLIRRKAKKASRN